MFFSDNILTKKGGSLGIVWIAANFQPGVHCLSLSRREYCSVSIGKACEEVMSPRNPMALRLSANLMIGIVRIHSQQTHYTYVESKHVWQRIKSVYDKNKSTNDLPTGSTRSDAVTLPDPTTQLSLNTTFPGDNSTFSLDSLKMIDVFSMSTALPQLVTAETPQPAIGKVGGSPYTADPKEISMEEETETPLETLQIQVPGEGGDFGDSVLVECGGGPVVMVDNVAMPLNTSDDVSLVGGVGDYSSDSAGVQPGSGEGELEEEVQGEMDSVLLFDEKTDSFQLFREGEDRGTQEQQETPILQPVEHTHDQPELPPSKQPRKRVRRKLAFDVQIKTKSSTIKDNMATAETTLRDKHSMLHPLPGRVKATALLHQPACVETFRSPTLWTVWHWYHTPSSSEDQPEFELDALLGSHPASKDTTLSVASILSDKELVRDRSTSRVLSPGASAVELLRAGDDKSLDSHHTTGLTATFSDVSSFASMRHHSNLGFETSSAQRQTQPNRLPLPNMDGLSPIADVETSFSTQHGELDLPDLDVSYSSSGTPRLPAEQHAIESEPLAYFSQVSRTMGGRLQMEFQELLPQNSSRRTACRAFAHVLELVTSQILTATQDQPYATIILQRGVRF